MECVIRCELSNHSSFDNIKWCMDLEDEEDKAIRLTIHGFSFSISILEQFKREEKKGTQKSKRLSYYYRACTQHHYYEPC